MTPEALTAALKPYGISTGHQVWGQLEDGTGANRRGLLRAEVLAAASRKEIKP
jgi:S-DNA-T family DNA segregation ATPase FtsK/SpoIIIE